MPVHLEFSPRNRYKYKLPLSYFPSRSSQAYFARLSLLRAVFSIFNSGMPRSIESFFFSLWISRNLRVLFGFSRVSFPRTLPTHIAIFCLFCSIYTWLSNCFSKLGFLYFIFLSLYYVSLPNQFFPFFECTFRFNLLLCYYSLSILKLYRAKQAFSNWNWHKKSRLDVSVWYTGWSVDLLF